MVQIGGRVTNYVVIFVVALALSVLGLLYALFVLKARAKSWFERGSSALVEEGRGDLGGVEGLYFCYLSALYICFLLPIFIFLRTNTTLPLAKILTAPCRRA